MKKRFLSIIISVFCIFSSFYACGILASAETKSPNNAIAIQLNNKVHKIRNFGSNKYLTVNQGYDINVTNVYQKELETGTSLYGSQEFRFEYSSGAVKIHPICSCYGRHRVLDIVKQGSGTAGLVAGCNVEIYAPTDDIAQHFNVTKVIVACQGEIRRILSDEEAERVLTPTDNETPDTVYVTCYRFTLKYNTNLALAAYGNGNGSASGTSSTSTGNVIVDTLDTSSYYQLWTLESSGVNAEEAYYTGLSPTYPLNSSYSYISSGYGNRGTAHLGIDIPAPEGTNLVSMFDGEIIQWGYDDRGYFIVVKITEECFDNPNETIRFVYMHLCEHANVTNPSLYIGANITAGTLIGKVGGTPNYEPHLHLAVKTDVYDPDVNNNITYGYYDTVNPMAFFTNHTFTFNNY